MQVVNELNKNLGARLVKAVLSEEWELYGHAPENPGLYEPLQLGEAALIIMLLPGPRSLAVNTWELALALESPEKGKPGAHFDKIVLLLPETVYHYICEVLLAGVADPKDFRMLERTGRPEPMLGAANSFAARWLCLAVRQRYGAADAWSKLTRSMSVAFYKDKESWKLGDRECEATLGKVLDLAERRLEILA